jgi:hypothetical protein
MYLNKDLLDALSSIDKVRELIDCESMETVRPLIIDQYHVIESKTLFGHVEEPHAHCTRPHHQTHELFKNYFQKRRNH